MYNCGKKKSDVGTVKELQTIDCGTSVEEKVGCRGISGKIS